MGKHRRPSGKGLTPAKKVDSDDLPSFDEKALSALTAKIEEGLGKNKTPQQLANSSSGNHKKGKPGNVRRDSDPKAKSRSEQNRGTKRDAQGKVKAAGEGKADKNSREMKHKRGTTKDAREVLLQEILALGGTEEDLDLVAGAASDDEDVSGDKMSAQDKSLKKELARFVAGLGIEGASVEDASEPEAEVEEEGEDWEETDASVESGRAPKKPAAAVPEVKKSDSSSKGANRLVSTTRL
jgi:ribosome biogenesis protein MAK21